MSDNIIHDGVRLRIAVIADTHLEAETGDAISRSNRRCRAAVGWIAALKPDLVVHLGDVVHPLPALAEQPAAFDAADRIFAALGAPMLVTPGNHDIGDKPNPAMPAAAVRGDWTAGWRDRVGSLWQSRRVGGCRIVLICASVLGTGAAEEAAQWQWLDAELAEARAQGERVFLFTHYPPFIRAADEPGHYDNLDPEPRARLLELASRHGVEAILSGHAHAMFFNACGGTLLHVVPSVAFARRDYAELARVVPAPEEEFGRNELGRLGFALLEVLEQGHALHPIMTEGSCEPTPPETTLSGVGAHPRLGRRPLLGVPLHHPWAEVVALPTNPPTAPFRRRLARDDRSIQLLWRLGTRRLRIPREDLDDPVVRARVALLQGEGFHFWLATEGLPDTALLALVRDSALEGWELSLFETDLVAAGEMLSGAPGLPAHRILAPIRSTATRPGAAASALFVGSGFAAEQAPDLPDGFTGWMARIGRLERVTERVTALAQASKKLGRTAVATVCLMPERPDDVWHDDAAIAARVEEAGRAALAYPDVVLWLDTFLDIDRGYHIRNGLADRRMRPRAAGFALAKLQAGA